MHPHLKSLLVKAGCDSTASDEEAQTYYDGMSADKKADIDAKFSKLKADSEPDGDEPDGDEEEGLSGSPPPPGVPTPGAVTLSAKQFSSLLARIDRGQPAKPAKKPTTAPAKDDDDVALEIEQKRVNRITALAKLHNIDDGFTKAVIAECGTFDEARLKILKKVSENAKSIPGVAVGEDRKIASLRAAIPQALMLRAGVGDGEKAKAEKVFARLGVEVHEEAYKLKNLTMLDMFRSYLVGLGCDPQAVYSMSRASLAQSLGPRAIRQNFPRLAMLAESTSDFANITLDAINKALRFNYLDAKRTWPIWAEKKFNADFKTFNSIALSEAPSMKSSNEGDEVKYVSLSDSKEKGQLVTYKAGIKLTRNAIINDDLDAFNAIPRLQANSAARLEDDVAYALLTANAAMADTGTLFNATAVTTAGGHANYTSSGSAPTVAALQTGATLIKKQKGLAGAARLELEPKFLLVPTSIEEQTKELIGSKTLIAQYTGGSSNPLTVGDSNPFFNRYQVVGSTRLDDNSQTAWYLLADYRDGQISTFQIYFLTDEPEPVLRQETDFDTEDVKYLVRHTVAGLVPEFRGAYKNAGA